MTTSSSRRRAAPTNIPPGILNLAAEPEVHVQVRGDRFKAHARTATTDEKPETVEDDDRPLAGLRRVPAQDRAREIPVVVLEREE